MTKDDRPLTKTVTGAEFLVLGEWLKQTRAVIYRMETGGTVGNGRYLLSFRYEIPDQQKKLL